MKTQNVPGYPRASIGVLEDTHHHGGLQSFAHFHRITGNHAVFYPIPRSVMKTTSRLLLSCLLYFSLPLASGYGSEGEAFPLLNPAEPLAAPAEQEVQTEQAPEAGDRMVLIINSVEHPFRWCPPGTFAMGSPISEPERRYNETQHQVTLTHGFWMLETEVTQEMWEGIVGNNPSAFRGIRLPVETVSWYDCQEYIHRLNGMGVAPAGWWVSLPTEAQWEYACRAGTTTPFHSGDTTDRERANFGRNLGGTTAVDSYPANAWGLHGMHGNVWEWCLDWYGNYPLGSVTDPSGTSSGTNRVLRGGGWFHAAGDCRSAFRRDREPSVRNNAIGLRLALVRAE